jgi:hypothetical protein
LVDCQVELRVVIWEAKDMEPKDEISMTNDMYIVVILQGINEKGNPEEFVKKTDIHFFAPDGRGSFNFRIKFEFDCLALRNPRLKFQARIRGFHCDDCAIILLQLRSDGY